MKNWDAQRYLDEFEKEILKEEIFQDAEMNRRNAETLIVVTKEKYVYKITENAVSYIGKQGENPAPDLQESDITFNITPQKEYTNTNVMVEIIANFKIGTNSLQYSMDGTTWKDYGEPITIEENSAIYVRLINELGEVGNSATKNITKIDKQEPQEAIITFNKTRLTEGETVVATVTQSDNGVSGVDITNCKYVFTTNNGAIGTSDTSKYTGGTFKKEVGEELTINCTKAGTYYLHVLTVDKAGNKKESIAKTQVIVEKEKELPNEAIISFNTTSLTEGESVIATVTQSDNLSGVDIKNCRYVFTASNTTIGTNDISKYTGGSFQKATEEKITLNCSQAGTYYLHVLTVDNSGNKRETISSQGVFVKAKPLYLVQNGVLKMSAQSVVGGASLTQDNGYVKFRMDRTAGNDWLPSYGVSWYLSGTRRFSKIHCKISAPWGAADRAGFYLFGGRTQAGAGRADSIYANTDFCRIQILENDKNPFTDIKTFSSALNSSPSQLYVGFQFYWRNYTAPGRQINIYELYLE